MISISSLHSREILDSRGNPTVEVDCTLDDGSFGRASVPSGASTGKFEAVELRDHDTHVFGGQGVLIATSHVNTVLNDALQGSEASDQRTIDHTLVELDGTSNDAVLGANAILGVSLAIAKASAAHFKLPLYAYIRKAFDIHYEDYIIPTPMMNVLNGGKHAQKSTDFQEFMIIPHANTFHESLRIGSEIFHALGKHLHSMDQATTVGDEGGYAPSLSTNSEPFEILTQSIQEAGYDPKNDVSFALDAAASEFYSNGRYILVKENRSLTSDEFISYFKSLINQYPIVSLEDILDQEDWEGWEQATRVLGSLTQLVGDDLFVTNVNRLQIGIDRKVANSILIKPNQIGTLSQTVLAIQEAKNNAYTTIISHRSGETEDTSITDIALALNVGQIKTGSLSRMERVAKYNQLLRFEEELGNKAIYNNMSVYQHSYKGPIT